MSGSWPSGPALARGLRVQLLCRAVCAGEFVVPPTKIELMYEPEVRGLTPSSTLKIEER